MNLNKEIKVEVTEENFRKSSDVANLDLPFSDKDFNYDYLLDDLIRG